MKSLKGYDESEITQLMLSPLPQQAFKRHQTKSYLTEISPPFTRERLTKVFGLHGVGWGLKWDPTFTDRYQTETKRGAIRYHFVILQAAFWFKMISDDGDQEIIIEIPVTGGSENDNLTDAMSGARTSAIGQGAKELLFQLHIYKNQPAQSVTTFNGNGKNGDTTTDNHVDPESKTRPLSTVALKANFEKAVKQLNGGDLKKQPEISNEVIENLQERLIGLFAGQLSPDDTNKTLRAFMQGVFGVTLSQLKIPQAQVLERYLSKELEHVKTEIMAFGKIEA